MKAKTRILIQGSILFLLLAVTTGCPFTIPDDTQDVLIEVGARRLGYHGGKQSPVIIKPGIAFCKAAVHLSAGEIKPAFADAIIWLDEELGGDPLLKEDLESLLGLIGFDPEKAVDADTLHRIRVGLIAFQWGLEAAQLETVWIPGPHAGMVQDSRSGPCSSGVKKGA